MDEARAYEIAKLAKHPGFQALSEELDAAEARYFDGVRKRAMAGIATSQQELDVQRGKFLGARLVVKQPVKAIHLLEKLEAQREKEEGASV